jgi:hypothetical protein
MFAAPSFSPAIYTSKSYEPDAIWIASEDSLSYQGQSSRARCLGIVEAEL